MPTRTLLNLGLLVLLALLAVLAVYEPGIETPKEPPRLSTRHPQEISRIEVLRRGETPIRLQREGAQWWLAAPQRMPANEALAASMLELLTTTSQGPYALSQVDPAALGLDQSRLSLRLDDIEIRFGNRNPLDQQRYVQIGDQAHLIADTLSHRLSSELADYASPRLLAEGSQPQEIVLPRQRLTQEAGLWRLSPPDQAVSADDIQAYVDAWKHARALKTAAYQAGATEGVITLRLAGQDTPLRLDILATEPELILGRKELGVQYHMGDASTAQLMRVQPVAEKPVTPAKTE